MPEFNYLIGSATGWQPNRSGVLAEECDKKLACWRPKLGDGTLYINPRVETRGYYFGHPYGIFWI